jgi:hypothetical protein
MRSLLRCAALVSAASLWQGCGPDQPAEEPTAAPPVFAQEPFQTVVSASGQLHVEVRWSPAVPARGADAVELTVMDATGVPVDGVAASVVPWMPAHGHGTSVRPVSTPGGPGVVVATPVYLYMPGEWQLRVTLSGAADDSAIVTAQIH